MPSDIKKSAVVLVISCISTLLAVYFDGFEFPEVSYSNPLIFGMNLIWALIIVWIIWDLLKGKDIKLTLIFVGVIMLFSLVWDFFEFGFGIAQGFYVVELLMFVIAYFLVNSKESRAWYSVNSV